MPATAKLISQTFESLAIAKVENSINGEATSILIHGKKLPVAYHGTHVSDLGKDDEVLFHWLDEGAFIIAAVREKDKPYSLHNKFLIHPDGKIEIKNTLASINIDEKGKLFVSGVAFYQHAEELLELKGAPICLN